MVKYMKFSWFEDKNNGTKKSSLIGFLFDQETGYLKVRWLGGSALPATEEVLSHLKNIIDDMVGTIEKYIPCHFKIIKKYGTSGCFDVQVIYFPYRDGFEDFGYVSSEKIHVSMNGKFNEEVIYEGNVYNFIALLERLHQILIKETDKESYITNSEIDYKEFTPWGKSLRNKQNNYEDDKF